MSVIFIALPAAIALAGAAVLAFILAVRQGQFDDLDTPPLRVPHDDE
jgi:cbb3-type cytochrome oxidase maturation protein